MFSGMGGGMGDAFASAMDGDDAPVEKPTPTPTPTPAAKEPTPDPQTGLTDSQKEAIKEKEKGNEFYKKKEFESAITHYDKAIELDPVNITYLTNKAGTYLFLKLKIIILKAEFLYLLF